MVNDGFLPNLITYPSTINYLDGSEAVLHKIISDPSFSEQQSWRDKTDWAQYYHLSPLRKNIVSWINYGDKPIRILELGAGCGAITSYLVTIPNAEVVAVEGSLDRAKVIQKRCKDTSNLQIHACSLDSFSPGHKFDVITLIGVLEYSGRYEKGENPFVSVLKRAAKWLTPDGTLIVAIENQLGCKYISGCPEDHYGTAYEGINRYPNYSGVRTFTSKALSSILSISGLPVQKWYYPYPDYKLPSVIFSDSALSNPDFDWMALTDVPPEPNENTKPTFNDRSFLTLLQEVTSISHFMNSFLVCASRDESAKLISQNSDTIAVKLNTKFRAPKFQTSTIFTKKESTISVVKKRLFPILPSVDNELYWQIQGTPDSYYHNTINIFDAVAESVFSGEYHLSISFINMWITILISKSTLPNNNQLQLFKKFSDNHFDQPIYKESISGPWISGKYIDLIPLNMLINRSGDTPLESSKIIDLEWGLTLDIPLQLVFDRGFTLLTQKINRLFSSQKIKFNKSSLLPEKLHETIKNIPLFCSLDIESCNMFETWFQQSILNGNSAIRVSNFLANGPNSLEQFLENVIVYVEQNRNSEAVSYFDKYRSYFSMKPELEQFDKIIATVRNKIRQ